MSSRRIKIGIIYHFFPHYRQPILKALSESEIFQYVFFASKAGEAGIEPYIGEAELEIHEITLRKFGKFYSLRDGFKAARSQHIDVAVIIGNPNILDTWMMAVQFRLHKIPVIYWAHGWLRREPVLKEFFRAFYFSLADIVFVYADRAKSLAEAAHFDSRRVVPIYNSLDWDLSSKFYAELELENDRTSEEIERSSGPIRLICTARLTRACRFDLLLDAMSRLKKIGLASRLVLIGDGPERRALEKQADHLKLDVEFLGAIYDERVLSRLIFAADFTVSPGKVGLTAMHSLAYGTPVITHGNLDEQMPEVEAIIEGRTGAFFKQGDASDLARVLAHQAKERAPRARVRESCRDVIRSRYTPSVQKELMENAISKLLVR